MSSLWSTGLPPNEEPLRSVVTLFTRRTELEEIISQANAALNDRAKHWHEENSLRAQRDTAKAERAEIILEIQNNERKTALLAEAET